MLKINKPLFFSLKKNIKKDFANNFLIFFCKDNISEQWLEKIFMNYSSLRLKEKVLFKRSNKCKKLGVLDLYSICYFFQVKEALGFLSFVCLLKQEHSDQIFSKINIPEFPTNFSGENLSFFEKVQILGVVSDNIYLPLNLVLRYVGKTSETFLAFFVKFFLYFYKITFIIINQFLKKLIYLLN